MDRKRAAVDTRIGTVAVAGGASSSSSSTGNKDPFTCEKEKERFLKDLRQFHEGRGTNLPRWPYIGGKPVDLHALYTAVTQLGGWEKVSSDESWADVQEQFGVPASCSNADYALRQIYIRYLNAYERLHHFGQDPDSREDSADLDDLPSSRKRAAGPVGGVAVTYNYHQHNIPDSTREVLGLPKELSRPSEFARIERSLLSGLPNELDFAVNICLLLSTEGKHTLKGVKALRIVELLLSHVGISKEADLALVWLIPDSKLNFLKFWNESVEDHEVKELLCPECLLVDKVDSYRAESELGVRDADSSRVLNLGRGLGTEDREAQRVIQLAVIIRNLSFEEENLECFASSLIVFRFVMLCIYSGNSCIRELGLDSMANIAFKIDMLFLRKMNLDPVDCGLSQLVLRTVSAFLTSPDKFEVVSALEMLSRLCQVELNEDAISNQLGDAIYEHLIRLLTIQDLQLTVSALETIYQLSEIGAATSNRIANVRASVDVLVALLTVEAQSYGPCNLPGISTTEGTAEVQAPAQSQAMGPPPARPAPSVAVRPPLPLPCVTSHVSVTPISQSPLPHRPPVMTMPVPASLTLQPMGSTLRAPVAVVPDNEASACNWLLAQYELSANSSLKKMEMYRKYASVFGVYGLQNLVSPTSFANCIRVTFPSVEQEFVDREGTNEIVYKGLTTRQKPGPFSPTTGDMPPGHQVIPNVSAGTTLGLAKTGLSLPITTTLSPMVVTFPAIQHVLQNSHGRPPDPLLTVRPDGAMPPALKAITATPSETNFVKTLLASKVAQHMNQVKVQQMDGQDANTQAAIEGNLNFNQFAVSDGQLGISKPVVAHILTPAVQNSHCDASRDDGSQDVLGEHAYVHTTEAFTVAPGYTITASTNGSFAVVVANQNDAGIGRYDAAMTARSLTNCDGDTSRGYGDMSEKSSSGTDCLTFNSHNQSVCVAVENSPVASNGTTGFPGKNRNNLHEDGCVERLNGKDSLPVQNGIVRDLVNGDCSSENSNSEPVKLSGDRTETWPGVNKVESENQYRTTGNNFPSARDTVSPFPPIANVDGLYDDVTEGSLQGGNKTTGAGLNHHGVVPGQDAAETVGEIRPQFEIDSNFHESVADNSEVLLLEDFTVAREEVLVSDMPDQLAEALISSGITDSASRPLFAGSQDGPRPISASGIQNSQDHLSRSLDCAKNSLPILTSLSQPLPIVIPANIQAKLASFQDGSSSMIGQPQVPFNAAMHTAISQSFGSIPPLSSTIFQKPLSNQNYLTSFPQQIPFNDTGQQHGVSEIVSNSSGVNCEVSHDLQSAMLFSAEQIEAGRTAEYQATSQTSGVPAAEMTHVMGNQSGNPVVSQNLQQVLVANTQSVQSTVLPAQSQNPSSIFVASSGVSGVGQGNRLPFMTSSMTSGGMSSPVRIPQLHRFVTAAAPGRIIIQRAQIIPQGQQGSSQGQQAQSLRPIQQPFFQRFIVSQAGGLPQRQILIQSSPMLMHQGVQGTGQTRPVFLPQTGQQASTGQTVVMSPAGQIFSQPGQRQAGPTAQLTAYRLAPMGSHSGHLVQHQVIGQAGQQGLVQRPVMVQSGQPGIQQGQVVIQTGQQMVQQDSKSSGQSGDQQSHGQVIVQNQAVNIQQGQMISHQGQTGHIFAPSGQLLVGQQGQILCQPGQGQNSGPVVIQHNGGQFVLHGGSNNLPGCLMSIPVSSFQHGMKRIVETSKDQTVGPSLTSSLCLSTSTVACRIITATTPLNSGIGVTASVQQSQVVGQSSPSSVASSAKKRKPVVSTSQSRLVKKRKKDGDEQTVGEGESGLGKTQVQYVCEWNGCQRFFGSFNSIFQHVTKDHFETIKESSITCEWTGCDTLKRQRWSFMTHLQDRHLNEGSLKAAAARRQQTPGATSPPPQASPVPPTAVYPANAALQAIRRFSTRPPFPELSDAKEGPVSKHIHLTSALILRNLARYSSLGRSLIKKHEKHLALLAFSETESSSAISNCLWELQRH